jgi:hypothetical protein
MRFFFILPSINRRNFHYVSANNASQNGDFTRFRFSHFVYNFSLVWTIYFLVCGFNSFPSSQVRVYVCEYECAHCRAAVKGICGMLLLSQYLTLFLHFNCLIKWYGFDVKRTNSFFIWFYLFWRNAAVVCGMWANKRASEN